MNEENTQKLIRDFPELYSRASRSPMERFEARESGRKDAYAMQWGFECGDGWFRLVYNLSQEITEIARRRGVKVIAGQVKEKFGTLRFHVGFNGDSDVDRGARDEIYAAIQEAGRRSGQICEFCGLLGEMRKGGWWHVSCDPCEEKYKAGGFR